MDTRTSGRKCRAALMVLLGLALAGCVPVYTIHSIAAPGDEPSTVPDISGLWMLRDSTWPHEVVRVTAWRYDVGQCRNASIDSLDAISGANETVVDQICFVPIAGHLVVQLRLEGNVPVYQHYLARFDEDSVSFCAAVWSDLVDWSDDHPDGTAAHGLEFTRREGAGSTELFVISPRTELLSYFEARLSAAEKTCDKAYEDGDTDWLTYVRLTTPREPDSVGR